MWIIVVPSLKLHFFIYSWFHVKVSLRVHSFNGDYLAQVAEGTVDILVLICAYCVTAGFIKTVPSVNTLYLSHSLHRFLGKHTLYLSIINPIRISTHLVGGWMDNFFDNATLPWMSIKLRVANFNFHLTMEYERK